MDALWQELIGGLPDAAQMARVAIRLIVAALLGAVVGIQRERVGKSAGIRTHMLVCMGTAFMVIVPLEAGFSSTDLSRVIQGIATGIGFIGGGAILKLDKEREITGLTTAAGIWVTAAIGVAVGLGRLGSAVLGILLTWIVLAVVLRIELRTVRKQERGAEDA
jgi:putative Mg2+ transporter-C (MgtC) family protein